MIVTVLPDHPGPRYGALLQLLRTSEALWNASRVFFSGWDLSPSQFNILNLLYGCSAGMSQVDLSRELVMHRSNVTGLVDRLEKRGLVERRLNPADRRENRIVLTSEGARVVQAILPHYYQAAEAVWGELPIERVEALVADLDRLANSANRIAAGSSVQTAASGQTP